ncbi:uncharacterized protein G2W53_010215 [Senna tora]|uniref:Uncharacterized protein n=1 Tax=Senna tora TaxID=362788 RepID=A0A834WZG9_9FABA|nr:uncharacterized protein G2W53_010215 [Senna tora]
MAHGSVGRGRLSSSKKKQSCKRRTDGLRRRLSSRISKGSFDKKLGVPDCSSFTNPAFPEIIEDAWFDLVAKWNCKCCLYGQLWVNASGLCGKREAELLHEEAKLQKKKKRTEGLKRRKFSHISGGLLDKKHVMQGVPDCTSIANTTIHRSIEEA